MTKGKKVTREFESALFNLYSYRESLLNDLYDLPDSEDQIQYRIYEVETLLEKLYMGCVTRSDWNRIQEIVSERRIQRYITCLNSGLKESDAAGSFCD